MNRTETGYKLPGERAHTARMLLEEEVASYTSGRQRVVRKNVAYEQALRAAASLTKLIAALKLDTKKAAPDEAGDGEDEDDDLDDY